MKKIINLLLLITFLCAISINDVNAQTHAKTPYEQKVIDIKRKYLKEYFRLSNKLTPRMESDINGFSDVDLLEVFDGKFDKNGRTESIGLVNTLGMVSNSAKKNYEAELEQAKKLKNATDFKREKDAAFAKSDEGKLKESIKNAFENSFKKGEFEKDADYQECLKELSKSTFVEICDRNIIRHIPTNSGSYELSKYDADKEAFLITYKYKDVQWQSKINVPLANAEQFKKDHFSIKIDKYDWGFVDNQFCLTFVFLINQSDNSLFEITSPQKIQKEITIAFDEFKIANPYLKGYIYKFSDAKMRAKQIEKENQRIAEEQAIENQRIAENQAIENQRISDDNQRIAAEHAKEKSRLDSIEIVNYNQRLDSIFQGYNSQLLQNPYNVSKILLLDFEKVEKNKIKNYIPEDFATQDKRIQNSMKNDFTTLNNKFESDLKSQQPSEFCKIYFEQNPEKKTAADKLFLDCRCKYSRSDFDLNFIESKVTNCSCRVDKFNEFKELFNNNKTAFDYFYDKGEDILNVEIKRKLDSVVVVLDAKLLEHS